MQQHTKFTFLSFEPQDIRTSLAQVAGRISEAGRIVAERKAAFRRADLAFTRTEAECYIRARSQIEAESKRTTEAQVTALVVTDPVLARIMGEAKEALINAECFYESAKADYEAIKSEADAVCEAARLTRAEMANLDPVVRSNVIRHAELPAQPQQQQHQLPHVEQKSPPSDSGVKKKPIL